jgi:hypothetical protein
MNKCVIGLSASTLLAMTPAVSAVVVVHENFDQSFQWVRGVDLDGDYFGELPGTFLDITKPAAEQTPDERRPGTIGKWYLPNISSSYAAKTGLFGESGVEIAKTTDPTLIMWQDQMYSVRMARDYAQGELVGGADNWNADAHYYWHRAFQEDFVTGTPGIGDPAYIGVRVKLADNQWHYGWIYLSEYQWPLAWAFETEPNVPIQIPVPAPAASMLMLVATATTARRSNR